MASFNEDIEKYNTINNIRYKDSKDALEIVEKFIKKKKLILVGGQALDYAFRLKNKQIYKDWELPDYDFYSSQHHLDAYELGKILCKEGFSDISVINARHITTMRVRIQFVEVADITFCPKSILDNLETLEYKGLKIISPHYQRLDQLLSLSRPYQNPPMEVLYHRAAKDLKRMLELEALYPTKSLLDNINNNVKNNIKLSNKASISNLPNKKYIYHGLSAFNLYKKAFIKEHKTLPFEIPDVDNDVVTVILKKDAIENLIKETNPKKIIKYKPYLDKRNVYYLFNDMEIHLDNENVTIAEFDGYKFVNIFYILFYFMFKYIVEKDEKSLILFDYLIKMASHSKLDIFTLSIKIEEYGLGILELLNNERMEYRINNKPVPKYQPINYYPEKDSGCKDLTSENKMFDITDNIYFDTDGSVTEYTPTSGGYVDEKELEHTLENVLSASEIIGCIHGRGEEFNPSDLLESSNVSCIKI